ncbi:MarR family transcriptional regulator [Salmonella enterica subsp. enterica serovar Dublin]|nr:MarR family transcriptional regulator [Salmonella enterica subsp. enterica serovar Dublin]
MPNATSELMQSMLRILRQQGQPLRSAQLQQQLQVSQPTASRALAALVQAGDVIKLGLGRNQHYGVPRQVPGVGQHIPVTAVDAAGSLQPPAIGQLACPAW